MMKHTTIQPHTQPLPSHLLNITSLNIPSALTASERNEERGGVQAVVKGDVCSWDFSQRIAYFGRNVQLPGLQKDGQHTMVWYDMVLHAMDDPQRAKALQSITGSSSKRTK